MLPCELTIQDDFPPVGYDEWRSLVDQSLKGVSFQRALVSQMYDGIEIRPVYTRMDEIDPDAVGVPGRSPYVRGTTALGPVLTGWDLRQEHAHPDLTVTQQAIAEDLQGGVSSVLLRLDDAARAGLDPDDEAATDLAGRNGVMAYSADDFDSILADAPLHRVGVALDAGAAFLPAAAALATVWQRRGVSPQQARGAFNADPLSYQARQGRFPVGRTEALSSLAALAKWTSKEFPHVTAVGVDTSPYHDAGATAAQDLAFAMATGVEYLRAMTKAGLDVADAARQIVFRIGIGTQHFQAIAKLRTGRQLWSRVVQACGGSADASGMRIHARTSGRVLTQRDPHVNLLRNTVAMFAAGVAGADAVTSVPFDAMIGVPDGFSRRIARNTVLVLQQEAHLHRVIDPAGGSWFLERLTADLAAEAWQIFQDTERQGGLWAALQSGWIARQIGTASAARERDVARRVKGITGVSEFPDINEKPVDHTAPDLAALRDAASSRIAAARDRHEMPERLSSAKDLVAAAVEAAAAGATIGQLAGAAGFDNEQATSLGALGPRRLAEPFEQLRDASDAWQKAHGQRPRVFLVNMGPLAQHTARATFSKNFFEAGGFEVITNDGFDDRETATAAFSASHAKIAVICSSDKLYTELVPQLATQLKTAGAQSVVLAGHPGDQQSAWQTAGVDRFIFLKCDAVATLRALLCEHGVLAAEEG